MPCSVDPLNRIDLHAHTIPKFESHDVLVSASEMFLRVSDQLAIGGTERPSGIG
jgi:hypothetical protein